MTLTKGQMRYGREPSEEVGRGQRKWLGLNLVMKQDSGDEYVDIKMTDPGLEIASLLSPVTAVESSKDSPGLIPCPEAGSGAEEGQIP